MITKAIVEEIVDIYQVRIRIPILDRITDETSIHTSKNNLNVATVCTLPNCKPNLQPGDIVFVSIDDLVPDDIVVLGQLYCSKETTSLCDMLIQTLGVTSHASLPDDTSIGSITSDELKALAGVKENIQIQIDTLKEKLDNLLQSNLNNDQEHN